MGPAPGPCKGKATVYLPAVEPPEHDARVLRRELVGRLAEVRGQEARSAPEVEERKRQAVRHAEPVHLREGRKDGTQGRDARMVNVRGNAPRGTPSGRLCGDPCARGAKGGGVSEGAPHPLWPSHIRNVDQEGWELLSRPHALRRQRTVALLRSSSCSSGGGGSLVVSLVAALRCAHELPLVVAPQQVQGAGPVAQARGVRVRRDADDAGPGELGEPLVLQGEAEDAGGVRRGTR